MQRRAKTLAAGLVLAFGTSTAGLLLGSGTAAAAEPVIAGSCGTTVQGKPGAPLALNAGALLTPVNDVLKGLPLLGSTLGGLVGGVIAALPPVPLGTVPAADGTVGGATIGAAATNALANTQLGAIAGQVGALLAQTCTITVKVVNDVAAPVQSGVSGVGKTVGSVTAPIPQLPNLLPPIGGGGSTPGTGGGGTGGGATPGSGGGSTPGGTNPGGGTSTPGGLGGGTATSLTPGGVPLYTGNYSFGRSPMADYSSMPYALAALYSPSPGVRYGGSVPGYSPEFGILGSADDDADGTVAQAGHAEALGGSTGNRIAVPVLLAVLALSGVTASLVRTWVLRRTVA
ncbi:hypothetical protein [Actinokineospora bangkokensis]|uniref:Uncharacterized protein n=1 Tax=Actinokineospora bangkokensis TaxID=1193682 RepID=A0A1Q9LG45_9PSEU|nr:hypothetical protein [Actinokineospora bangkokensis]OLR91017.1 hypothetical protein BJP25_31225 [Actinokineospora bangkokensis]